MDPRLRRFFSIDRAELSRPYFLATVAVVIGWIAVNSDAALLRFDLLGSLVRDARLEGPGVTPILVYATYPASVALFGSAVYLLRRERLLSVYYAASAPVLAIVVFEILWHLFGAFAPTFPPGQKYVNFPGYLILGSWTALGLITVRFWTADRWTGLLLAVDLALWVAWLAAGYPQISGGSPVAYAFNFALKLLTFVLVGLLLVPRGAGGPAPPAASQPDRSPPGPPAPNGM